MQKLIFKRNQVIFIAIIIVFFSNMAAAASRSIFLPNPDVLGTQVGECIALFDKSKLATNAAYPDSLLIDIKEQRVTGIMVVYDYSITSDMVQNRIDALYGKWLDKELHINGVKMWRIIPYGFTIQMTTNEDNKIQVIFMRWYPADNKGN